MLKNIIAIFIFCLNFSNLTSQTLGVKIYDPAQVTPSYTFLSPMLDHSSYLVDDCGFMINKWERNFFPGLGGHFLEDGSILRTAKASNAQFSQASRGGLVEHLDWDGNLLWAVNINDAQRIQHHDAVMMPNGNMLVVGWERIDATQQIAYGRPVSSVSDPNLWGEFIYEVERTGVESYNVVWEWHLQDHFIQDVDATKLNYGVIADNPGKVNINYNGPGWWGERDWWHCNALDYHSTRDEIVINSRNNNEVWIIDHSTTSEEAAMSTGGDRNKGGDLLYRWGNPQAYEQGTNSDLKMYGSHGIHFIKEGLPNAGKIMYFNNGDRRPGTGAEYSTIEMIAPPLDMQGDYLLSGNNYGPDQPEIAYKADTPSDFHSTYLSNAQQLANGNVFINEGENGRLFEVNAAKEIVWEYVNPIGYLEPLTQGAVAQYNRTFRAYRYPVDHAAFQGKNIEVGEVLQLNDPNHFCSTITSIAQLGLSIDKLFFDLSSKQLFLDTEVSELDLSLAIFNFSGMLVMEEKISDPSNQWDLSYLSSGVYSVRLASRKGSYSKKIMVP